MVLDVLFDERSDKVVAVIVSLVHLHLDVWVLWQRLRFQLACQEVVVTTLLKHRCTALVMHVSKSATACAGHCSAWKPGGVTPVK